MMIEEAWIGRCKNFRNSSKIALMHSADFEVLNRQPATEKKSGTFDETHVF